MKQRVQTLRDKIRQSDLASTFSEDNPLVRFTDLREIGHGSFGAVYYAYDNVGRETVAIKKMAFDGKNSKETNERWTDITKEVRILQKIRHPNVVKFRGSFLQDTTCWLVMQYCIGSTADMIDVLKKGLSEEEIAAITYPTLLALEHLHGMQFIHRDLKASNILLTDSGNVCLADFGSAAVVNPAQTFIGTPFFMAPEVIMAMEDGIYTEKSDLWSLGITIIELAERRPPLFSMNAMSALYHIALNDPPSLEPVDSIFLPEWTNAIHSFLSRCLVKEPDDRASAAELLQHEFIARPRRQNVILDLISRTKELAREVDNGQYNKMRKLLILDGDRDMTVTDDGDTEFSYPDRSDSISVSTACSLKISHGSVQNSITSAKDIGNGSSKLRGSTSDALVAEATSISSGSPKHEFIESVVKDPTKNNSSVAEKGAAQTAGPSGICAETEVENIRKSKFSTLRTAKTIAREHVDFSRQNMMLEVMNNYKRLRQAHNKDIKQLEEKCRLELDATRQQQEKALENLIANISKEKQRSMAVYASALEKKKKELDDAEKKLKKAIVARQQAEFKSYVATQLKEYKYNKEMEKQRLRQQGVPGFDAAIKAAKERLNRIKTDNESAFRTNLTRTMNFELKENKRVGLLHLHALEEQLDNDQFELMKRHHRAVEDLMRMQDAEMCDLERRQMDEIHAMKTKHQEAQHKVGRSNHESFARRKTEEMQKRHAAKLKAQPKENKLIEQNIRKQYRVAVREEIRRSKLMVATAHERFTGQELKDMVCKIKEDEKRAISFLTSEFELKISAEIQENSSTIDSQMSSETVKLQQELREGEEALVGYQQKQEEQLRVQVLEERQQLHNRFAIRQKRLEEKLREKSEAQQKQIESHNAARMARHKLEALELDGNDANSTSL